MAGIRILRYPRGPQGRVAGRMSGVVVRPSPLVDEPAPLLLLRVAACKQAIRCAYSWPTSLASTSPIEMPMRLPLSVDKYYRGFSGYVFLSCYVPAGKPRSRYPGVFAAIFAGAVTPRRR